ncbi:hypothetical protein ACFPRL_15580 [Pseudoclavibacter helvolus]
MLSANFFTKEVDNSRLKFNAELAESSLRTRKGKRHGTRLRSVPGDGTTFPGSPEQPAFDAHRPLP